MPLYHINRPGLKKFHFAHQTVSNWSCLVPLQAMGGGNLALSNKKQREIYVGNLTIGVVTDTMLRDLFNGALAHLVPDPVANPPVINAALDPSGMQQLDRCMRTQLPA